MTNRPLDQLSPDEYRARYEDLKDRAARRKSVPTHGYGEPPAIGADKTVLRETIPGGWYAPFRIRRGDSLRLVDVGGEACASVMLWNADVPDERYCSGDTVKLQWTARLSSGRLLFSDMGRVLASMTYDTAGGHDPIVGGSTRTTAARRYGEGVARNSHDNIVLAAAKFGLGVADVPTPIAFFADVRTDDEGRFHWHGAAPEPGRLVELRAEMNLLVAVSNCPHPFDPGASHVRGPIEVTVWRSPPAGPHDLARHWGEEAERGYLNTDREFSA